MPPNPEDDPAGWQAHAEPGQTVERSIDGIGRLARNVTSPSAEARRMARVGTIIIAAAIGLVVVILVVAVILDMS